MLPVSTAWGRVGTALGGALEARKYEDYETFKQRWETLCEQVAELERHFPKPAAAAAAKD